MLAQLIALLLPGTSIVGVPHLGKVTQPPLVSVLRGKSVTINCTFIYNGTNSEWVYTAWYKTSPLAPYVQNEENTLICIPDGTPGGFSHCIASLKIERASFDHSEYNYTCLAQIPTVSPPLERRGQGTWIQIYEPPEVSIVDGALVAGRKSSLTCSAKGLYSENISFIWACHGINISTNVTTLITKRTGDGTSVVTNRLEIVPKVRDHGTVCRCQINHVTFRQPVINEVILHVLYGPQDPKIIYRLNNTDSYHPVTSSPIIVPPDSFLELRCSVDSNPASSLIWMKDRENHTEMLQIAAELNSSIVKIKHLQSEDGGVYWCTANNSYGWGNASVWIKAEQEDSTLIWIFVIRFIAVAAFIFILTTLSCLVNC
ncbi:sialic acid-binding Ig-like lectin 14 [Heptranchias perlo]|uniref:sialic acid-binding Ig-like lectin 14 n=1 Tax=Heptranchias perlo TaxID=212740 RepID=UPI00355A6F14